MTSSSDEHIWEAHFKFQSYKVIKKSQNQNKPTETTYTSKDILLP